MQIVVLAGGSAVDAEQVPAALSLIRGRPFVDWQLDGFVASGARRVVMCVGPQGDQIETHVRRALDRGLSVSYSYAGEQLVGSGGALRRALGRLEREFVVADAGWYLPFDYSAPLRDLQAHPAAQATLSVCQNLDGSGSGNVALDGEWVTKYEPGARDAALNHVDCGAIALRRSTLEGIEDGAVWGVEALLRKLARQQQLRGFVVPERGYDVGSVDGRRRLEGYLATQAEPLLAPV